MEEAEDAPWHFKLPHALARRLEKRSAHIGIAIAVGTEFDDHPGLASRQPSPAVLSFLIAVMSAAT
jgi:hypothetical protein